MFRVTHIKLHNICQFEDIEFDINRGLSAICGRNGQGKTSLLRALVYGLTGCVDGSWGNQQRLQRDGSTSPGYVEVTITREDSQYLVKRYCKDNNKLLDTVSDITSGTSELIASKRSSVDAFMHDVFGIPVQLFFQICWGRQGQLDALLSAPAAAINTFLASVFDVKRLEKHREKLKIAIDTIANYPASIKESLEEAQESLKALPPIVDMEKLLKSNSDAKEALSKDFEASLKNKTELQYILASGETEFLEARKLLETYAKVTDANDTVAVHDPGMSVTEASDNWHMAREEAAAVGTHIIKHTQLLKDARAQLSQLQDTMSSAEILFDKVKAVYEDNSVSVCELCGNALEDTDAYKRKYLEQQTGFTDYAEFTEHSVAHIQNLVNSIQETKESVNDIKKALDNFSEAKNKAENDANTFAAIRSAAIAYSEFCKSREEALSKEGQLKEANKTVADYSATMAKYYEEDEHYAELQDKMTDIDIRINVLEKAISDIKAEERYLKSVIETNSQLESKRVINDTARAVLVNMRSKLSAQKIQARYLEAKIDDINTRIAGYMQDTDMPFTLYLNKDTHVFEYITTAGYVHPAAHLSGAQKSISSVILQMAMLEVISPAMNLFLVDEPSEALDAENKFIMAELFQKLNRLLPAIEGIMLIVTRDEQIIDSCESVIQLNEGAK